jgi:translation initiation factor IF-3
MNNNKFSFEKKYISKNENLTCLILDIEEFKNKLKINNEDFDLEFKSDLNVLKNKNNKNKIFLRSRNILKPKNSILNFLKKKNKN